MGLRRAAGRSARPRFAVITYSVQLIEQAGRLHLSDRESNASCAWLKVAVQCKTAPQTRPHTILSGLMVALRHPSPALEFVRGDTQFWSLPCLLHRVGCHRILALA
jgi:hypothetical protein